MIVLSGSPERRSLLNRWHASHNALFSYAGGPAVVEHYGDPAQETASALRLGLCDLSLLPRAGMTGPGAATVLAAQGIDLPARPNLAVRQAHGDLVARLSGEEYLQLSLSRLRPGLPTPAFVKVKAEPDQRAYWLPRADSHSLLALCGQHAPGVLAKLCGVDCSSDRFADGQLAQTSVARQNCIVIRHDLGKTLNYLVLTASPATEYLWECLLDAMSEFEGGAIGTAAFCAHSR